MSIYDNATILPFDLQGWHSNHPIFGELISKTTPSVIIEVGSWKGASAIHMAELAKQAHIYCVDTWLGGIDHMLSSLPQDHIPRQNGYPTLYQVFLSNVIIAGFKHQITPIPQTSSNGSRYLKAKGIQAQLIYIDASHEYPDAYLDMVAYWDLLVPGGIMFGDDFGFPGVSTSLKQFSGGHHLKPTILENNFWQLQKKP